MNKKLHWITETAVMLALLIALQWAGSQIPEPLSKQLLTGTFVNAVLAVTVLVAGLGSGITVALISPVLAYVLKIAPQPLTVPAIMIGNCIFVLLLYWIAGKDSRKVFRQVLAWLVAAGTKFAALYAIVVWLICGVINPNAPKALTATFSWPQLVTALIGGGVALLIVPLIRKALKRNI